MEKHQKSIDFIKQLPCELILRNLALWLSAAIDKGILLEHEANTPPADAVPAEDNDPK